MRPWRRRNSGTLLFLQANDFPEWTPRIHPDAVYGRWASGAAGPGGLPVKGPVTESVRVRIQRARGAAVVEAGAAGWTAPRVDRTLTTSSRRNNQSLPAPDPSQGPDLWPVVGCAMGMVAGCCYVRKRRTER